MSIEFNYKAWNPLVDAIPEQQGPGHAERPTAKLGGDNRFHPYSPLFVAGLVMNHQDFGYPIKSREYQHALDEISAAIWSALAWCRKNGVDATEMARRVNNFEARGRTKDQALIEANLAQIH